jgi:hypothetical protein
VAGFLGDRVRLCPPPVCRRTTTMMMMTTGFVVVPRGRRGRKRRTRQVAGPRKERKERKRERGRSKETGRSNCLARERAHWENPANTEHVARESFLFAKGSLKKLTNGRRRRRRHERRGLARTSRPSRGTDRGSGCRARWGGRARAAADRWQGNCDCELVMLEDILKDVRGKLRLWWLVVVVCV